MRKTILEIDWLLLLPVIFLILISLTVLFSINPDYFRYQIFTLAVSVIVFLIVSQISYHDYQLLTIPAYLSALTLLIIVFIIGFESRGAIRWLDLFGISLQASEIAKPMLSIALAGFLSRNENISFKTYILSVVFLIPAFILIYYQPDLGSALLFVGVTFISLIVYGIPLLWLIISLIPLGILAPFVWNGLLEYQKQRILTFLHPLNDPTGSSYNLIQAIIAVGSGGILGKGISGSTQVILKFLPENHTDFIFASLAEKLGFLGSLLTLIFFILLLFRIYKIFTITPDVFGRMLVCCFFLFLTLQFFVNIGMNLGIVPIVGITLPFLSYGGSSLLANFIMLGILSSISVRNLERKVLEIK